MPGAIISVLFIAFSVAGSANGEALRVNKSQVIAATAVKKPVDAKKVERSSAPEESKEDVKSES